MSNSLNMEQVYQDCIENGKTLVPEYYTILINGDGIPTIRNVQSWTDILANVVQFLPNPKFRAFLRQELTLRSQSIAVKDLITNDIQNKNVKRIPHTNLFIDKSWSEDWIIVCLRDLFIALDKISFLVTCYEVDEKKSESVKYNLRIQKEPKNTSVPKSGFRMYTPTPQNVEKDEETHSSYKDRMESFLEEAMQPTALLSQDSVMNDDWLDHLGDAFFKEDQNDADWFNAMAHGSLSVKASGDNNKTYTTSEDKEDLIFEQSVSMGTGEDDRLSNNRDDFSLDGDAEPTVVDHVVPTIDDEIRLPHDDWDILVTHEILSFDKKPPKIANVVPTAIYYQGVRICSVNCWSDMHWQIILFVQQMEPAFFDTREARNFFNTKSKDSRQIPNTELWVDTHKSASDTVLRVYNMIQLCGIDGKSLKVTYGQTDKTKNRLRAEAKAKQSGIQLRRSGEQLTGADERASKMYVPVVKAERPLADPPNLEGDEDDLREEYSRMIDVLCKYFVEGYSGGLKQRYRFMQRFEECYRRSCCIEDEALDETIAKLTWNLNDRGYRPETVLSDEHYDKLMGIIAGLFEKDAPFIEYQALIDQQEEAGDSYLLPMKTAEELCTYLQYTCPDYIYFPEKISETQSLRTLRLTEVVSEYIQNIGEAISIDALRHAFPYLSRKTIEQNIDAKVIIKNSKDQTFIHIDNIGLNDDDYEAIAKAIADGLRESAPMSYALLFERLSADVNDCLQSHKEVMLGVLKLKLGSQYEFGSSAINVVGASLSLVDILDQAIGHQDRVTMAEIETWIRQLNTKTYSTVFTYIYDHFCRINETDFVPAENVTFEVDEIDRLLDAQRTGDYLLMKDIRYDTFPYSGYAWNKYLLYSFIYKYSKKYKLKNFTNFPFKKGEGGVAVLKKSGKKYEDILCEYLACANPFPMDENSALTVLVDAGLIERKIRGINVLFQIAKKMRNLNSD